MLTPPKPEGHVSITSTMGSATITASSSNCVAPSWLTKDSQVVVLEGLQNCLGNKRSLGYENMGITTTLCQSEFPQWQGTEAQLKLD